MRIGTPKQICTGTAKLAAWVIFWGLVIWGFMLYTRNEWAMW